MSCEIIAMSHIKQSRVRVRKVSSNQSVEDQDQASNKRARLLALLKGRYGYSNDKAVDDLERLLKQFSKVNKSLATNRIRPGFKRPPGD